MAREEDDELIRRIAGRDTEAMRELYRLHGRKVYGIALAVCADASTAEEVTQDVFLRVWNRADTYDPARAKVVTWLARIAHNRAVDAVRRAAARPGGAMDGEPDFERFLDSRAGDPGDSSQAAAQRLRVRDAVNALPAEQRRVLELAFFRGLTHQEIADYLGEPLGTVKTRIRESLQKLRGALAEEAP